MVIAETLEAATEAATLLSPRYEAEPARIGLDGDDSFIGRGYEQSAGAALGGREDARHERGFVFVGRTDARARRHVTRAMRRVGGAVMEHDHRHAVTSERAHHAEAGGLGAEHDRRRQHRTLL